MVMFRTIQAVVPRIDLDPMTSIILSYSLGFLPIVLLFLFDYTRRREAAETPKGCRQLGLKGFSNLSDEYDSKYSTALAPGDGDDGQPRWRIKSLSIHPVKSCKPVELHIAKVVPTGLEHDRQFCFAEWVEPKKDGEKGGWEFITLRNPRFTDLVHVCPEIWLPDPSASDYSPKLADVKSGGVLVVRYPFIRIGLHKALCAIPVALGLLPSQRSFKVPLIPGPDHTYPTNPMKIWKDSPTSIDMGIHLPEDFKTYLQLKKPMTLFRTDPDHYREVYRCAPRKEQIGYQPITGFADAYPIHLLNLASVHDVGQMVANTLPRFSSRRFRCNIVVTGPGAYDEDDWKRIRVRPRGVRYQPSADSKESAEGVEIYCACHTVRCRLPNVDPDTAHRHPVEPDKTLKRTRCIDEGDPKNACLGLQLVPAIEGEYLYCSETGT